MPFSQNLKNLGHSIPSVNNSGKQNSQPQLYFHNEISWGHFLSQTTYNRRISWKKPDLSWGAEEGTAVTWNCSRTVWGGAGHLCWPLPSHNLSSGEQCSPNHCYRKLISNEPSYSVHWGKKNKQLPSLDSISKCERGGAGKKKSKVLQESRNKKSWQQQVMATKTVSVMEFWNSKLKTPL